MTGAPVADAELLAWDAMMLARAPIESERGVAQSAAMWARLRARQKAAEAALADLRAVIASKHPGYL